MKRLLYSFALLSILASCAQIRSSNGNADFSDVDEDYEYADAIDYLYEYGVIEGYSDGTYRPYNEINRAEFTKILIGSQFTEEDLDDCDVEDLEFSDIDLDEWYAPYLCIAKNQDWIEGYSDGTFHPDSEINFVEAAKIVGMGYGLEESADNIWYQPYVEFLEEAGAIPPSVNSFSSKITRGEMAEIIYRVDSGEPNEDSLSYDDLESGGETYADIDYGFGEGLLPLGDDKVSTSAKVGYIYSCDTSLDGGGAFASGDWLNELEGYWDPTMKPQVDGSVDWNQIFSMSIQGDERMFSGNGLPDHVTGVYPISQSDDAYDYDRNPNSISEQDIDLSLPLYPELASAPHCASGTVGIAVNGVPIFNGFDAGGRDAVAHEIQDVCDGHPQQQGQYHYHNMSSCLADTPDSDGHSDLIGYALDGFGIYGPYGEEGEYLTNEDLDGCHGHTHDDMYHYHATAEFPYTVGCFMGEM